MPSDQSDIQVDPNLSKHLDSEQSGSAERECNCLIPYLEGAGQHSPGCSIFTPEEREANREEARRRAARYRS